MNFDILFENKNLIAIDKPSGFLSVPSRWGAQDKRPCLGTLLQQQLGQQIYPVHRLDEETTGVILYAKTKELHKVLNAAFENHTLTKIYQAICEINSNSEAPKMGELLKDQILRGKKRSYTSPVGQNAETLVLNTNSISTELLGLELKPLTGRSHQLRFQLSSRGFAILGDVLYGSKLSLGTNCYLPKASLIENSIALRAIRLDLTAIKNRIEKFDIPLFFQVEQNLFY